VLGLHAMTIESSWSIREGVESAVEICGPRSGFFVLELAECTPILAERPASNRVPACGSVIFAWPAPASFVAAPTHSKCEGANSGDTAARVANGRKYFHTASGTPGIIMGSPCVRPHEQIGDAPISRSKSTSVKWCVLSSNDMEGGGKDEAAVLLTAGINAGDDGLNCVEDTEHVPGVTSDGVNVGAD
jgi:hypothetical protein